jgi:amino acid transporter
MRRSAFIFIALGLIIIVFLFSPFNDQTTFQFLGNPSNDYKGALSKIDFIAFASSIIFLALGAILLIADLNKRKKSTISQKGNNIVK